jgi:hypothetical protein
MYYSSCLVHSDSDFPSITYVSLILIHMRKRSLMTDEVPVLLVRPLDSF